MVVLIYVDSHDHADLLKEQLTTNVSGLEFLLRKEFTENKRFRVTRVIEGKVVLLVDRAL